MIWFFLPTWSWPWPGKLVWSWGWFLSQRCPSLCTKAQGSFKELCYLFLVLCGSKEVSFKRKKLIGVHSGVQLRPSPPSRPKLWLPSELCLLPWPELRLIYIINYYCVCCILTLCYIPCTWLSTFHTLFYLNSFNISPGRLIVSLPPWGTNLPEITQPVRSRVKTRTQLYLHFIRRLLTI